MKGDLSTSSSTVSGPGALGITILGLFTYLSVPYLVLNLDLELEVYLS